MSHADALPKFTLGKAGGDANGVQGHARSSQFVRISQAVYPRIRGMATQRAESHCVGMSKKPSTASVNNLRAWREFRGLTQEQLAEIVGTAGNVIGLLESGGRGLSSKWLMRLAPALGTTPGFLLDHDPNDIDASFLDAAMAVPAESRAQVKLILDSFKKPAAA